MGAVARALSSLIRRLGLRFGDPPPVSPFSGDLEASKEPAPKPTKTARLGVALRRIFGAILTLAPPLVAGIRKRLPRFWDLLLLGGVFLVVLAVSRIASWQLVPEIEPPGANTDRPTLGQPLPQAPPQAGALSGQAAPPGDEGPADTTRTAAADTTGTPESGPPPVPTGRPTSLPGGSPAPRISPPARVAQAAVAVTPEGVQAPAGSDVGVAIRVSGSWGRPVVDKVVEWSLESGTGGMLRSESVRTDSQGVARNVFRLPPQTGQVVLLARVRDSDLPEVRFEITVLPPRS